MEKYLKDYHSEEITDLLNDGNSSIHVSINIDLIILQNTNFDLYSEIVTNTEIESQKWDNALLTVQKSLIEGNIFLDPGYQIKESCHVRFTNLPTNDIGHFLRFPTSEHVGLFVQINGQIVRKTQAMCLEYKRDYFCPHCKKTVTIKGEYGDFFIIKPPQSCREESCRGVPYTISTKPNPDFFMDIQEICIQELLSEKHIPSTIVVSLENDLVDLCQPGDCVTICGTVEKRWSQLHEGKFFELSLAIRAVSIVREKKRPNNLTDLPEHLLCIRAEWQDLLERHGEMGIRDLILKSFCPEIHGMYIVKLAVALSLCSLGGPIALGDNNGDTIRGNSHLLLIGDPGMAKSRLLIYASKIAVRSVYTTGMGCSSAGLTAAARKENGEWQLEAGALVIADNAVCCIDEFNLMQESDKMSIHQAMEQQKISIAKAGLVCELTTRCAIIAASNPKNVYTMCDNEGMSGANIGLDSPLLSRFDVVLILRDEREPQWDDQISDHLLKHTTNVVSDADEQNWSLEKLQNHFMAIRDIDPEMTAEANAILGTYFKYCRADPFRDESRTSVRLLDSLERLARAHARLVFRSKVTHIDAVAVIQLMESSWGFGRLIKPLNVIKHKMPIGPCAVDITDILNKLQLTNLLNLSAQKSDKIKFDRLQRNISNIVSKQPKSSSNSVCYSETYSNLSSNIANSDLDNILSLDTDINLAWSKPTNKLQKNTTCSSNVLSAGDLLTNSILSNNIAINDLDNILSLDTDINVTWSKPTNKRKQSQMNAITSSNGVSKRSQLSSSGDDSGNYSGTYSNLSNNIAINDLDNILSLDTDINVTWSKPTNKLQKNSTSSSNVLSVGDLGSHSILSNNIASDDLDNILSLETDINHPLSKPTNKRKSPKINHSHLIGANESDSTSSEPTVCVNKINLKKFILKKPKMIKNANETIRNLNTQTTVPNVPSQMFSIITNSQTTNNSQIFDETDTETDSKLKINSFFDSEAEEDNDDENSLNLSNNSFIGSSSQTQQTTNSRLTQSNSSRSSLVGNSQRSRKLSIFDSDSDSDEDITKVEQQKPTTTQSTNNSHSPTIHNKKTKNWLFDSDSDSIGDTESTLEKSNMDTTTNIESSSKTPILSESETLNSPNKKYVLASKLPSNHNFDLSCLDFD